MGFKLNFSFLAENLFSVYTWHTWNNSSKSEQMKIALCVLSSKGGQNWHDSFNYITH